MRDLLGPLSRRDLALLAALLAVFVGLATFTERQVSQRGSPAGPALSIHSNEPDGSRALFLWLQELGYRTDAIEFRPFRLDPSARLLFLLAPLTDISPPQLSELQGWVERGGTLVVATERPNSLLERLGAQVKPRGDRQREEGASPLNWLGLRDRVPEGPTSTVVARQPVFENPSVRRVEGSGFAGLTFSRPEWVAILGQRHGGETVAGVVTLGRGRVYAISSIDPLSNGYLGRADNWALVMHLLSGVPAGSLLLFDEYHHGLTESGTLNGYLLSEPWGWAILYGLVLAFAYVALSGRRFGRAAVPVAAGSRRERSEYVATMAALFRHGSHQVWLCRQFAGQVKRSLSSRYRIPADLPAADFVSGLSAVRPEAAALAAPLERLEGVEAIDEATALALMREANTLRSRLLS